MKKQGREFDKSKYQHWIDPAEVKPYERNAKIHTDKQIENIANSIRRFGWQQDTVLTADNVCVIGHGRRLAAIKLGCDMPFHRIDKTADALTDEDIRELRIADNQTNAETGMDFSVLEAELEDLSFDGFDFDFDIQTDVDVDVDGFFDRGVETKEKETVFGVKVICGTEQQRDELMAQLEDQGYAPTAL